MRKTACFLFCVCASLGAAEVSTAPRQLTPDERYKADLLLIVAHPDDDVVIGGYLARIAFDEHKRVAVIYCTSGDGGGNAVGNEAGAALGQLRTIEARRAMGFFGIDNVWFLGAHDTPGQDVLRSLDNWNHGRMLDEVIRLVRITRPEVIMTWMPNYVVGENHGDHQASGVLATEAFDMAGDPTQFPEQVTPPRDRTGMLNLTEGLHPWQTKKLYFFSDAFEDFGPYWHNEQDLSPFRKPFLPGKGPTYPTTAVSPSKHETYAKLTAEQQLFYQTQEGYLGKQALGSAGLKGFEYPVQLLFGKSVVGGQATGDVFENVGPHPASYTLVPGYRPVTAGKELSLSIGGPWEFYKHFWQAHNLEDMGTLIPVPEVAAEFKQSIRIPLTLKNDTPEKESVRLTAQLPDGWTDHTPYSDFTLEPGEMYSFQARLAAPQKGSAKWEELSWTATGGGKQRSIVKIRVFTGKGGGLPQ